MAHLQIRNPMYGDAVIIAGKLRPMDHEELAALGSRPRQALEHGAAGTFAKTIVLDGTAEGMFGWSETDRRRACIWMLGSEKVFEQGMKLGKLSHYYVNKALSEYDQLFNYVSENNEKSMAWLDWLGFRFPGDSFVGKNGVRMRYFVRSKSQGPRA